MDPEANMKEQIETATEIMKVVDCADDSGEYTEHQKTTLIDLGYRLAELVMALDEWNRKTRPVSAGL